MRQITTTLIDYAVKWLHSQWDKSRLHSLVDYVVKHSLIDYVVILLHIQWDKLLPLGRGNDSRTVAWVLVNIIHYWLQKNRFFAAVHYCRQYHLTGKHLFQSQRTVPLHEMRQWWAIRIEVWNRLVSVLSSNCMRQDVANSVLQYNTNKGILRVYPYYYLVIRAMLNYTKSIPLL